MCGPTFLRAIKALFNLVLALIIALLGLVLDLIYLLAKVCSIIVLGCGAHEVHVRDPDD